MMKLEIIEIIIKVKKILIKLEINLKITKIIKF